MTNYPTYTKVENLEPGDAIVIPGTNGAICHVDNVMSVDAGMNFKINVGIEGKRIHTFPAHTLLERL